MTRQKGARWKRGSACSSNPTSKKHRTVAAAALSSKLMRYNHVTCSGYNFGDFYHIHLFKKPDFISLGKRQGSAPGQLSAEALHAFNEEQGETMQGDEGTVISGTKISGIL